MRKNIITAALGIIGLIMAVSLCACGKNKTGARTEWPESISLGDAFPDFTVPLSDGTEFTLSEALKTHKAVYVNIWTTWCGPCREEFPDLNEAYKEYSDDVAVVCLSGYDDDTIEDVAEYKEQMGLDLPMGKDTAGVAALVANCYPTSIIIDRFGNYTYNYANAFPSANAFKNLFDIYLADDYDESQIVEGLPTVKPDVEAMSDEELTKAVCPDGSLDFTTPSDDELCWPFVKASEGVTNSNAGKDPSGDNEFCCAEMDTVINAKKGDILTFDYDVDSKGIYNGLSVSVNDSEERFICDKDKENFEYVFSEDGSYTVKLVYRTEGFIGDTADTVVISNASLATGSAAQALLKKIKTFPQTLKGSEVSLDVPAGTQEIIFDDPNGIISQYFGKNAHAYITNGSDSVNVHVCIGADLNPYFGIIEDIYGVSDRSEIFLSECDTDETGFNCELEVQDSEKGGNTFIAYELIPDFREKGGSTYIFFANEENTSAFLDSLVYADGTKITGISWTYADGTAPSTDKAAASPDDNSPSGKNPDGTAEYTIHIVDENGDPVDGCVVNVCTDISCNPAPADGGSLTFTDKAYPYTIHIIKYPDGYTFDKKQEFTMPEDGGELTITVPHEE